MIKKVYVLNLAHRTDRKYFMLGHLATVGVPLDLIEIFPAKYGGDYDTLDEIIEDGIADGFPEFEDYRKYPRQYSPSYFSYLWNWCRMLREIQNTGLITLVLLDDRLLQIDWHTLNNSIKNLMTGFKLLQIGWWINQENTPAHIGRQVNELIKEGTHSGDWATVLSPAGASLLLDAIYRQRHGPEWYLGRLSTQPIIPGVFHCIESLVIDAKRHVGDWGQDMNSLEV